MPGRGRFRGRGRGAMRGVARGRGRGRGRFGRGRGRGRGYGRHISRDEAQDNFMDWEISAADKAISQDDTKYDINTDVTPLFTGTASFDEHYKAQAENRSRYAAAISALESNGVELSQSKHLLIATFKLLNRNFFSGENRIMLCAAKMFCAACRTKHHPLKSIEDNRRF